MGNNSTVETGTKTWSFSNLTKGRVWLNITTTDAYGRTRLDVYTYIVDVEVTTTPILTITSKNKNINNITFVGVIAEIDVSNRIDEPGESDMQGLFAELIMGPTKLYLPMERYLQWGKTEQITTTP